MYKKNSFLAIIPARGGSKGIKKKNLFEVDGKPLIQFTIETAKSSKYLDKIIVSTDAIEIAEKSKKYGADVPFLRPGHLATDKSKTIDVVIHAIEALNNIGDYYDYVVLLQPTQPLRTTEDIDLSIEKIVDFKMNSLVSVVEVSENPILMRTINEDETLENLLTMGSTVRRQDFPDFYKVDGSIYINKIDENLSINTSLNDNKLSYVMNKNYSVDIDSELDIEIFKYLYRKFF
ncbi:cytidylyltransferase domain-containing protein [Paraliobacillus sp. JSM ZJ581]|uniref:acylneuraminate cytidylyltransferase family protein n=1 Tax=Paraliobacillus sp. JSM ZJ581 TaxID=3342118 RepID=UPI0035A9878E